MIHGSEKMPIPKDKKILKYVDDNRIIKNRKRLRKSGLDELPQIINIIK